MSQTLDAGAITTLLQERMGLSMTPREAGGLALYLDLLLRWNARMNLTAIREPEAIVLRHFGESLVCARLLALPGGASLLDYGSGAGFPGMVCALAQPEAEVTLAESQGKKAAFLREAARVLGLSMVRVHGERVETLPRDRRFDVVTLRAVDAMETACVEAAGRVGQEGRTVVLTTKDELPRLSSSLAGWDWREPVAIPGSSGRVIAVGMRPRVA